MRLIFITTNILWAVQNLFFLFDFSLISEIFFLYLMYAESFGAVLHNLFLIEISQI